MENTDAPKQSALTSKVFILMNVIKTEAAADAIRSTGARTRQILSPVSVDYVCLEKSVIKLVFLNATNIGKSPIVPLVRLSALESSSVHTIA